MALPSYLKKTKATVEQVEETKTFTPHIKLLTPLSKEVKKSSDKYIPSAEEGLFCCDGEVFDKFSFVIMDHNTSYKVWKDLMPLGTYETLEEANQNAEPGSKVNLHKDFAIKFVGPDKMAGKNAIISLSGTSKMITAKTLLHQMNLNFKKHMDKKTGEGPDFTAFVYTYSSELISSNGNDFWVFKLQEDKEPVLVSEAIYIQAKQDQEELKSLQDPSKNLLAEGDARGI